MHDVTPGVLSEQQQCLAEQPGGLHISPGGCGFRSWDIVIVLLQGDTLEE